LFSWQTVILVGPELMQQTGINRSAPDQTAFSWREKS
jgi:hypothetical protein